MAARNNLVDIVRKALAGKGARRELGGSLPARAFNDARVFRPQIESPETFISAHGLTERHFKDDWTPEQIAEA